MRPIPSGFQTHIDGPTTTLAMCWRVTRVDGAVYRYTDHDVDLPITGVVVNGVTLGEEIYKANIGGDLSAAEFKLTMGVNNLEIAGFFVDAEVSERDLIARLFNNAQIRMFAVNWADPTMGYVETMRGWFGEITRNGEAFKTEVRSLSQALAQSVGSILSDHCRSDFGATGIGCDTGCFYPIDPPEWTAATNFDATLGGSGAVIVALPNGHSLWDGGTTDQNVEIINGGTGYSVDATAIAYYTVNGDSVEWPALAVTVVAGVITDISFAATAEGEKPNYNEVVIVVSDTGHTLTHVIPTAENGFQYELIQGGVTGGSEPTWPTAIGDTVTDGTAVWRAVAAVQHTATVTASTSRKAFSGNGMLGDISSKTVVLGTGASILANPNGHGLWDGGDSPSNVQIVDGGIGYHSTAIVKALYIDPDTGLSVTDTAIEVGVTSGVIVYVKFDPTALNHKPIASQVQIYVDDPPETDATAGFFDAGTLMFTSGDNVGIEIDIQSFTDLGSGDWSVVLYSAVPFVITNGTTVTFKVGCDKRFHTCANRFHNKNNFRAEKDIPGSDVLFRINTNI